MKFKREIDWAAVKTAVRTAGALMVGNVFVSAFLLGNRNWLNLGLLLLWGAAAIITTSTTPKE